MKVVYVAMVVGHPDIQICEFRRACMCEVRDLCAKIMLPSLLTDLPCPEVIRMSSSIHVLRLSVSLRFSSSIFLSRSAVQCVPGSREMLGRAHEQRLAG